MPFSKNGTPIHLNRKTNTAPNLYCDIKRLHISLNNALSSSYLIADDGAVGGLGWQPLNDGKALSNQGFCQVAH